MSAGKVWAKLFIVCKCGMEYTMEDTLVEDIDEDDLNVLLADFFDGGWTVNDTAEWTCFQCNKEDN